MPKAPVFAPVYNWTGFYLGINGGGGWGHSAWTTTNGFDVSGGLIGGTAGCAQLYDLTADLLRLLRLY